MGNAVLLKLYGGEVGTSLGTRDRPAERDGARKVPISGKPDKAHVSTSRVER